MGRLSRISNYEWELLEDHGYLANRSIRMWYEIFLATNDTAYLERLLQFWQPPDSDSRFLAEYSRADFQAGAVQLPTDTRLLRAISQDPERMLGLEWRLFEEFVAELLVRLGYEDVQLGRGTRDGGIDISAYHSHPVGVERIIVQCKRFQRSRRVGSPSITQLLGTVDATSASRGLIVTTSSLTRPAQLLVKAHSHRLSALSGRELRAILRGIVRPGSEGEIEPG